MIWGYPHFRKPPYVYEFLFKLNKSRLKESATRFRAHRVAGLRYVIHLCSTPYIYANPQAMCMCLLGACSIDVACVSPADGQKERVMNHELCSGHFHALPLG